MTPQLVAYLFIAAWVVPAVVIGYLLNRAMTKPAPVDHTVLIGRVGWRADLGAYVEWSTCDPTAEAEAILRGEVG